MKKRNPRPFLKWVGGKRQLLSKLLEVVDSVGSFGRYHEPFLGGGALFFALARADRLSGRTYLSDINPNLIDAYQGLRQNVGGVIRVLKMHKRRHCEEYFYQIRARVPATQVERVARIIYLNKTCFNGLYRENSKGKFNVPIGSYDNPNICDEDNLRGVAATLRHVDIEARDFTAATRLIRRGDLVYFDPPYNPVSKTSGFTHYAKGGFGVDAQENLARMFTVLAQRGAHVILSNSLTPLMKELYKDFHISEVSAKRSVNSRTDRRGEVLEVLVTTFPLADAPLVHPRVNSNDRAVTGD